jgi:hypothetical protein
MTDPIITRTVDDGVTNITVYIRTPGGNEGHVNMARHVREDPLFWPMLRHVAAKVDAIADVLRVANVKQLEE